jgi:hypothetical protein
MTERTIVIYGDLPAKKNRLRPRSRRSRGRAHMYDERTAAELSSMELQARVAWGSLPAVSSPAISVRLFLFNFRKDPDGIWTTTLDVLKKARVIIDDRASELGGKETKYPVQRVATIREERIEVTLKWKN